MRLFSKKNILAIAIIFLLSFVFILPVLAQVGGGTPSVGGGTPSGGGGTPNEIPNPIDATSFDQVVQKIANWAYLILGPIAVLMILYAGFLFMTSGGNEEKVKTAKRVLTWALVGIAIIVIGAGFITFIKDLLGTKSGTTNPTTNFSCASQADVGKPCPNGATCQSTDYGYTCISAAGTCSGPADVGKSCPNGGTCQSTDFGYTCVANTTTTCNSQADVGKQCLNGSTCQATDFGYTCL